MTVSLKTTTFKNIGFNVVAKVMTLLFSAVTNIVLARNLISKDYGIVGFALIFINFLTQFNDFGINSAVIQKKELNERELYTGFTIKAILGCTIFSAAFLISPLSKYFADETVVVNVIKLLSLNFLINIFAFLPASQLTRDLDYKKLIISQIVASLVYAAISIILALNGFKYLSIVIGNLCATAASVIVINLIKPLKIKFEFDKQTAKEFIQFGGKLFLSGIIIFVILNSDNFIVGAVEGSRMLGYYALAFQWGFMICSVLGSVVLSVLFPTYSKMQQDKNRIKNAYLTTLEYISFFSILANLSLFIVSKEFLFFVLGQSTDKWFPALAAFRILCIYGIVGGLLIPVGPVVMAIGKPQIQLKATLYSAILQIALLYPALKYAGIEGVSIIVTISMLMQYLIYFPALKHELGLNYQEVLRSFKSAALAGLVVAIEIFIITSINVFQMSFSLFLIKATVVAASFVVVHGIITKWKLFKEIKPLFVRI